jgi:hypothetical protein
MLEWTSRPIARIFLAVVAAVEITSSHIIGTSIAPATMSGLFVTWA